MEAVEGRVLMSADVGGEALDTASEPVAAETQDVTTTSPEATAASTRLQSPLTYKLVYNRAS